MKRPKLFDESWAPPVVSLLICVLIFAGFNTARGLGWLQRFELSFYDVMLSLRWQTRPAASDVIVIGIDERDMAEMERLSPSDHELAGLLRRLQDDGAAAIGLDLVRDMSFLDPTLDSEQLQGPRELAEVLNRPPYNIVAITRLPGDGPNLRAPAGLTIESGQLALAEIAEDVDGVVRRGIVSRYSDQLPDVTNDNKPDPALSLAFRLAELALQQLCHTNEGGCFCLGNAQFEPLGPDDGPYVDAEEPGHMFLLDYAHGPIKTIDFLHAKSPQHFTANEVKGKVILIGKASDIDKDYFDTPLRRDEFGVNVHAMIVDQLLRSARSGKPLPTVWSDRREAAWIFMWTVLGGLGGFFVRRPLHFAGLLILGALLPPAIGVLAFNAGRWIPVVPPCLTFLTSAAFVTSYAGYRERRFRDLVEKMLNRAMDRRVVRAVIRQADEFLAEGRLKPQKLTASVLFTDIQDFGSLSAGLAPEVLMPWLNEYMEAMSKLVSDHDGIVNKYIGDSIMAVFGVPIPRITNADIAADAANAVRCALKMRTQMVIQNARWAEAGRPTVGMRIGIHTGELVAGSLGNAERMEYTVIGDTVNTASRLESLKAEPGAITAAQLAALEDPEITTNECRILISEATHALLGGQFRTKAIQGISLKGVGVINVFGVVGSAAAAAATAAAAASRPPGPSPAAPAVADNDDEDEPVPAV